MCQEGCRPHLFYSLRAYIDDTPSVGRVPGVNVLMAMDGASMAGGRHFSGAQLASMTVR